MNPKLNRGRDGMAILAFILLIIAVIIIVGAVVTIFVNALRKLDKQINPTEPTNQVAFAEVPSNAMVLQFPSLPPIANATADHPLGDGWLEVERSTNLVDWTPLLRTNADHQFTIAEDTNAPADRAFYRMKVVIP